MKLKAKDLVFISQINRDGSGTTPVPESYLDCMLNNPCCKEDFFKVRRLSISEDTYIAMGFNSFVVKIKKQEAPCSHIYHQKESNVRQPRCVLCDDTKPLDSLFIKKISEG